MKQRQITMVAIACGVLGALCVAAFMWAMQNQTNAARAEALARYGGEQVEVCVATRDVAAGERLDASALETRLWVADLLPDEAVSNATEIAGKTATSSILKGEVISKKRFREVQGTLDVPAGQEAVSVPAKAVQAVGGAIRPGMSVDVYSLSGSGATLLARDVIVLATSMGDTGSLASTDSGWVTLAVNPERVEELIAASGKSNLHFVLPGDAVEDASDKAKTTEGASDDAKRAESVSGESKKADSDSDKSKRAESVSGEAKRIDDASAEEKASSQGATKKKQ